MPKEEEKEIPKQIEEKEIPKQKEEKEIPKQKEVINVIGKKPLSAYMLYNNYRRPILRSENPDMTLPFLAKAIGEEWKELP